ncbi:MAG: InlB B-repeat-containing protein [Candidatus Methanomethylophilaceae archaeon]|nr:InlB B-repeat-containing protein [Candidatus Methanomethylophilaceae archaeon]
MDEVYYDAFYWMPIVSAVLPEGTAVHGAIFDKYRAFFVDASDISSIDNMWDMRANVVKVKDSTPVNEVPDTKVWVVDLTDGRTDGGVLDMIASEELGTRDVMQFIGNTPVINDVKDRWGIVVIDTDYKVYFTNHDTVKEMLVSDVSTVTFHYNDGTDAAFTRMASGHVGTSPFSYLPGKTFAGWYTAPVGGELVLPDATIAPGKHLDLYAHWDGTLVYLEDGVIAHVNGSADGRTGSVVLSSGQYLTLEFEDEMGLYTASGFTSQGGRYYPMPLMQSYSITAQPKNFTNVVFDRNGGEGGDDGFKISVGETNEEPFALPSRTGYVFEGYESAQHTLVVNAAGNLIQYVDGFTDASACWTNTASSVTLTAVWVPKTTVVTLDNGGVVDDVELEWTYDEEPDSIKPPTSDSARFDGYFAKDDSGNDVMVIDSYGHVVYDAPGFVEYYLWKNDAEEVTLTAKWVPKYSLYIDIDGISDDPIALSGDESYFVGIPELVGHRFIGWTLSGDTSEAAVYGYDEEALTEPIVNGEPFLPGDGIYVASLSEVVGGSVHLTAQWQLHEYTISFDLDGGEGDYDTVNAVFDVPVKVPEPTREGWSFLGWELTVEAGHGILAAFGDTIDAVDKGFGTYARNSTPGADVFVVNLSYYDADKTTLTAKWTPGEYTVRYLPNGEDVTGSMSVQVLHFGDEPTPLLLNQYSKVGHSFLGWATEAEGDVVYENSESVQDIASEIDEVVDLYAVWKVNQYTITFSNTHGNVIAPITQDYGTEVVAPVDPSYPGMRFTGWNPAVPATMPAQDMTVEGTWVEDLYTVKYAPNGGTGSMEDSVVLRGDSFALRSNVFSMTGHKFASWNTAADGSGSSYSDGQVVTDITDGESITLYVQWAPAGYTVRFNSTGSDPVEQAFVYGVAQPLAANTFVNDPYVFDGWNTAADGSGVAYSDGQNVVNLSEYDGTVVDLYAQWKNPATAITLDKGTGTSNGSATVSYGDTVAVIKKSATGNGYLLGYYAGDAKVLEATGALAADTAGYIADGMWIYTGAELTLTAKWIVGVSVTGNDLVATPGALDPGVHSAATVIEISNKYHYATSVTSVTVAGEEVGYAFSDTDQTVSIAAGTDFVGDVYITAVWALRQYTVALDHGPGGDVAGAGTFDAGTEVTISAIPDDHFTFVKWSDESTVAVRTFTLESNVSLTATFTEEIYTVTLVAGEGGSVTGAGGYAYGSQAHITATPDVGYSFARWDDAGADSDKADRTFTVASDITLTAIFEKTKVNVTADGTVGGHVEGTGVYDYGASVTLTAVPDSGFQFVMWENGSTGNPRTLTATTDIVVSATFDDQPLPPVTHTLSLVAGEGGSVTGAGSYVEGSEAKIVAIPDEGYRFVRWSDGVTDAERTVTVNSDSTLEAFFELIPAEMYDLVLVAGEGGTVAGSGTYAAGTEVEISAVPTEGYVFVKWSDGITDAERIVTVDSDITLTAEFASAPSEYFTLQVIAGTGGATTGSGSYAAGAEVQISAVPDEGYRFVQWSDGVTDAVRTVVIDGNVIIEATFEPVPVETFELELVAGEGGEVSGAGVYPAGTEVQISATPNDGYEFVQWSDGSKDAARTVVVDSDMTLEATFVPAPIPSNYDLVLVASEGGVVSGAGKYPAGTEVQISATPNDGYEFVQWDDGSTDAVRTVTVDSDMTLTAEFSKAVVFYELELVAGEGGEVAGAGTYPAGADVEISATPDEGYVFVQWDDGSTDAVRRVLVNSDMTFVAEFASVTDVCSIELTATEGGSVTGSGTYPVGSEVAITAIPDEGYVFMRWSDGSDEAFRTVVVLADIALVAEFEPEENVVLLMLNAGKGGSVSGSGLYAVGTSVAIEAVPDSGYRFVRWDDGSYEAARVVVLLDDTVLSAYFERIAEKAPLSLYSTEGGYVNGSGSYEVGTVATAHARASDGYIFVGWDDGNTEADREIVMDGPLKLVANFSKRTDTYTVRATAGTGGSVTGAGTYVYGTTATLVATPATGYHFVSWSDGSKSATLTLKVVSDVELSATFSPDACKVTVSAGNGGTVEGAGTYDYGTKATIKAVPDEGYHFVKWSDGSTDVTRTVTVTGDAAYVAEFAEDAPSSSGFPWIYVVIAIIVILAVAIVAFVLYRRSH